MPSFECKNDVNNKGLVNSNIGLITTDEIIYAGGHFKETKNNYYLYNRIYTWTMSPAKNSGNHYLWAIDPSGVVYIESIGNTLIFRPVINLKSDTQASGTGASSDPFVVQ